MLYNANRSTSRVIEPTICSLIKRTADGVRLGAFGIYYEKGTINGIGQPMNETGVIREPRSLIDVCIAALTRLSEIRASHKHCEVCIKTAILPIVKLIRDFQNTGLKQYKSKDGIDKLKQILQGFDNVTVLFRRERWNARSGKLYQARMLAVDEFELREDSDYWENGIRIAYSDGACSGNGKKDAVAAGGAYWGPNDRRNRWVRVPGEQTNNRGEYMGAIALLETAIKEKIFLLIICVDTQLLIDSIEKYMPTWKRNGWKTRNGTPVKNRDLLERIDELMGKMEFVGFKKCPAHSGHEGNDGADAKANEGVRIQKKSK